MHYQQHSWYFVYSDSEVRGLAVESCIFKVESRPQKAYLVDALPASIRFSPAFTEASPHRFMPRLKGAKKPKKNKAVKHVENLKSESSPSFVYSKNSRNSSLWKNNNNFFYGRTAV